MKISKVVFHRYVAHVAQDWGHARTQSLNADGMTGLTLEATEFGVKASYSGVLEGAKVTAEQVYPYDNVEYYRPAPVAPVAPSRK